MSAPGLTAAQARIVTDADTRLAEAIVSRYEPEASIGTHDSDELREAVAQAIAASRASGMAAADEMARQIEMQHGEFHFRPPEGMTCPHRACAAARAYRQARWGEVGAAVPDPEPAEGRP